MSTKPHSGRHLERPRRFGLSTVVVCAAVVAGQLAGITYEARAVHRFCSEHRQIEHADEAPATITDTGESSSGPSAAPLTPMLAGASGHEHCLFLVTFGDDLGLRRPQPRIAEPFQRLRPSSLGNQRLPLVDLLTAPKTSPPSATVA